MGAFIFLTVRAPIYLVKGPLKQYTWVYSFIQRAKVTQLIYYIVFVEVLV